MILIYTFALLLSSAFSQKAGKQMTSFSFVTSRNKQFTLSDPKQYLSKNRNVFSRFARRLLGKQDDPNESNWYYIHFQSENVLEAKKYLDITNKNTILKGTYIVYLKENQLEEIENLTLVKKLEQEDKFLEDGGPLESTNYFHVSLAPNEELPPNDDLYIVERREDEDTFLVRIDRDGSNDRSFNRKKKNAVEFLTNLHTVRSVSTFTRPTVKNNLMTGYTQQNSRALHESDTGIKYFDRFVNQYSSLNLRGKDQIVTIQDTPIDFYHAMFRDDNVQMQLNTQLTNHRKFVYYGSTSKNLNDWSQKVETNEHGTHVAGTTAGDASTTCQNINPAAAYFNGNAPEAKILYAGNLNDVTADRLGSLMKQYGSYVSTNSWGVNGYNNQYNTQYGKLAYDNPERLFIFAAGNEYDQGNFTVCDPGGSKNVLTVGAMGDFFNIKHTYSMSSGYNTINDLIALIDADPWAVGKLATSTSDTSPFIAIDGTQGNQCSAINSGKISILYAASTDSIQWIYKCQLTSTFGILFTKNVNAVQNMLNQQVSIADTTEINKTFLITHADYSSGGPGNKGILKPDIMTPGTRIISAKSNAGVSYPHGCNTVGGGDYTFMQGTSMATPNAAGAALLVREYFYKYWQGLNLDSTTLRALLINSCRHPRGSKTPDVLFGHGIVDLSTILPTANPTFGVKITPQGNGKPSVGENKISSATIYVKSSNQPLQVTLSYLDPVLSADSPIPISRDLDLVVIDPRGEIIKGDHLSNGDSQHFSTNEKIIIDTPIAGNYYIKVVGGDFVDASSGQRQEFAVVVTGDVVSEFLEFTDDQQCICDQCSTYEKTQCQCLQGQIGLFCQGEVRDISADQFSVNVGTLQMERVYVRSSKTIKSLKVKTSNKGDGATIWAADKCYLTLGQYSVNGKSSTGLFSKEAVVNIPFNTNEICVAVFNNNYEPASYSIEISDKEGKSGFGKTNTVIVVVVAIAAIAVVGVVLYCCCCKKRGGGGDSTGGVTRENLVVDN